jgi:hypothetical protein
VVVCRGRGTPGRSVLDRHRGSVRLALDLFVADCDLVVHFGDLACEAAEPAILLVVEVVLTGVVSFVPDRGTRSNECFTFATCFVLLAQAAERATFGRVSLAASLYNAAMRASRCAMLRSISTISASSVRIRG